MKKIIFLDVDGVFNCEDWYRKRWHETKEIPYPLDQFCPNRVKIFNRIIKETSAVICISSSWRGDGMDAMKSLFNEVGIEGEIIGLTPHLGTPVVFADGKELNYSMTLPRGNEIKWWLDVAVIYPWYLKPECSSEWEVLNEDGTLKHSQHGLLGKDYTYCIIDDDDDMLYEQRNNFVNTNAIDGLTEELADLAIKILNS